MSHQLDLDESRVNSSPETRDVVGQGQDGNSNPKASPKSSPQASSAGSEAPAAGRTPPVASSTPTASQDAHLDTDMSDTTESEPDKVYGKTRPIGETRHSVLTLPDPLYPYLLIGKYP